MNNFKSENRGLNIHLQELADINILVGENGSGKSRVLEEIVHQNLDGIQIVNIRDYHKDVELIPTLSDDIISSINGKSIKFSNIFDFFINDSSNSEGGLQSAFLTKISPPNSGAISKMVLQNNKLTFTYSDGSTQEIKISGGYEKLFQLYIGIEDAYIRCLHSQPYQKRHMVFLIDEIESSFHPEFIKKIPKFLEFWLKQKQAIDTNSKFQFFISTHSPFLISSFSKISDLYYKIYLLKGGQTIEVRGEENTDKSKKGYTSDQTLLCVNQMLGARVSDLSNKSFVLAEESIHKLIQTFSKKIKRPINHFSFSTAGDSDTINRAVSLADNQKIMPSLDWAIFVIFDGKSESLSCKKVKELKGKIEESNFLYIKDDTYLDLETTYEDSIVDEFINENCNELTTNWDRSKFPTFQKYLNSIHITVKTDQGIWKAKLAEYIIEKCTEEKLRHSLPFLNKIFPIVP